MIGVVHGQLRRVVVRADLAGGPDAGADARRRGALRQADQDGAAGVLDGDPPAVPVEQARGGRDGALDGRDLARRAGRRCAGRAGRAWRSGVGAGVAVGAAWARVCAVGPGVGVGAGAEDQVAGVARPQPVAVTGTAGRLALTDDARRGEAQARLEAALGTPLPAWRKTRISPLSSSRVTVMEPEPLPSTRSMMAATRASVPSVVSPRLAAEAVDGRGDGAPSPTRPTSPACAGRSSWFAYGRGEDARHADHPAAAEAIAIDAVGQADGDAATGVLDDDDPLIEEAAGLGGHACR